MEFRNWLDLIDKMKILGKYPLVFTLVNLLQIEAPNGNWGFYLGGDEH